MNSHSVSSTAVAPLTQGAKRSRVVLLAILAIGVFAAGDLVLTVFSMQTTGMFEGNPFVCFLVRRSNSALPLVAFKLISNAVGASLLYVCRRKLIAQAGSSLVAIAYAGVMVQWHRYTVTLLDAAGADLAATADLIQISG